MDDPAQRSVGGLSILTDSSELLHLQRTSSITQGTRKSTLQRKRDARGQLCRAERTVYLPYRPRVWSPHLSPAFVTKRCTVVVE